MKAFLENNYTKIKEDSISGRWIRISDIEPLYSNLADFITVNLLGFSEEKRPIYRLRLGNGPKKILIWSQMHGNESTGTKALFDFLNYLKIFVNHEFAKNILTNCTIECVPLLNPDGAEKYTRVNANAVDLNRDAIDRLAIESNLLRSVLDEFKPDFCFNLHDQRTIFGVSGYKNPATLSFLAPSEDESRTLTEGRKQTMNVIGAMNKLIQEFIPNHVGRYTDEFYPTATGDNFQKLGFNTILVEAGHYPDDYQREKVREFNFYALLKGVYYISKTDDFSDSSSYFNIPNNVKSFVDVLHISSQTKIMFQYVESIVNNSFTLTLEKVDFKDAKYGHKEI